MILGTDQLCFGSTVPLLLYVDKSVVYCLRDILVTWLSKSKKICLCILSLLSNVTKHLLQVCKRPVFRYHSLYQVSTISSSLFLFSSYVIQLRNTNKWIYNHESKWRCGCHQGTQSLWLMAPSTFHVYL